MSRGVVESLLSKKQRGMTLLELLVSLVVVSIGMFGVSALQARSYQYSNEAYYMTQASFLAQSMMERIRANHDSDHLGSSVYTSIATMKSYANAPTISTNCASSVCTQAQMATYDMNHWLAEIDDLPLGAAKLTWSGTTATIVIRWQGRLKSDGNCDEDGAASKALEYRCFTLSTTFPS